jgi:hypothetical protein
LRQEPGPSVADQVRCGIESVAAPLGRGPSSISPMSRDSPPRSGPGPDGDLLDVPTGCLRRRLEAAGEPRILDAVGAAGFVLQP